MDVKAPLSCIITKISTFALNIIVCVFGSPVRDGKHTLVGSERDLCVFGAIFGVKTNLKLTLLQVAFTLGR